jgi:hypothetical protein
MNPEWREIEIGGGASGNATVYNSDLNPRNPLWI